MRDAPNALRNKTCTSQPQSLTLKLSAVPKTDKNTVIKWIDCLVFFLSWKRADFDSSTGVSARPKRRFMNALLTYDSVTNRPPARLWSAHHLYIEENHSARPVVRVRNGNRFTTEVSPCHEGCVEKVLMALSFQSRHKVHFCTWFYGLLP